MQYLHTMVRVHNLDKALDFYCNKLGLVEMSRKDSEKAVTHWFSWQHQAIANKPVKRKRPCSN